MRFLRRGGGGETRSTSGSRRSGRGGPAARDDIARDIPAGRVAARAPEISKAVDRLHPKLAWELGKGATAEHALVVIARGQRGVAADRPRWAASAPPFDATWEYHPSRQPGPPHTLQIGGATVAFADVRAVRAGTRPRGGLGPALAPGVRRAAGGAGPDRVPVPRQPRRRGRRRAVDRRDRRRSVGPGRQDPRRAAGRDPAARRVGDGIDLGPRRGDRRPRQAVPGPLQLVAQAHRPPVRGPARRGGGGARPRPRGRQGRTRAINAAEEELETAMADVAVEVAHVTDPGAA